MTANIRPLSQTSAAPTRNRARMAPLAVTLLVWLFAVSLETGYVAVLDSGIAQLRPAATFA